MDTDLRETMRRTTIMKKENSIPVRNSLLLLLTATIWGVAFVAQSVSMAVSYTHLLPSTHFVCGHTSLSRTRTNVSFS